MTSLLLMTSAIFRWPLISPLLKTPNLVDSSRTLLPWSPFSTHAQSESGKVPLMTSLLLMMSAIFRWPTAILTCCADTREIETIYPGTRVFLCWVSKQHFEARICDCSTTSHTFSLDSIDVLTRCGDGWCGEILWCFEYLRRWLMWRDSIDVLSICGGESKDRGFYDVLSICGDGWCGEILLMFWVSAEVLILMLNSWYYPHILHLCDYLSRYSVHRKFIARPKIETIVAALTLFTTSKYPRSVESGYIHSIL